MSIKELTLEERLLIAICRFSKEQNAIYDTASPEDPYVGEDHVAMMVRFSSLDGRGHFMAFIKREKNGSLKEPLYLNEQSTPLGDHYEKFCAFIAEAPYNIAFRER